MLGRMADYGISVPDRQLACAPVRSPDGRAYLGAMAAAANFGRANRQLLTEVCRTAFDRAVPGTELELLYDVSHNLAKLERHTVDGEPRLLCVHRKGATRALPPGDRSSPRRCAQRDSPCSFPGRWAPRRMCSSVWRAVARSTRRVTVRGA
jgi:tRNA-splicing ligase RtcB